MVRTIPIVCMVLLFTGWQAQQANSIIVTAVIEVIQTAYEIYETVDKIKDFFEAGPTPDEQFSQTDLMVFDKLDNIADRLEKFENRLISTLSQNFDDKFTKRTKHFYDTIDYVDELYSKFLDYSKNLTLSKNAMRALIESTYGHGYDEISHRIVRMHNTLIKKNGQKESLLDIITNQQEPDLMCRRQQSMQQIIWEMYQTVVTYDLKVISLKLMSMQFMYNDTLEFQYNAGLELTHFERRNKATYKNILQYMPLASRNLWKCDPPQYRKDYSYSKLQEIFQGFIINEQDTRNNTCSNSGCADLNNEDTGFIKYIPQSDFAKDLPNKLRCSGRFTDCVPTAEELDYCVAPLKDDRRYEGMKTTKTYGHYDDYCPRNHHLNKKWAFLNECSFCLCTCISNKLDVDRYFSLKPAKSRVTSRMVVTGVRLRKIDHVIYIEIQEGRLGPNGTIVGKPNWIETPDKTVNLKKILRRGRTTGNGDLLKNKQVYSVHWDQRTVFLDDIEVDSIDQNLVLTGLSFKQKKDALALQVRLSPFDYETGKILGEGEWIENKAAITGRRKINLDKADDPLKYKTHNIDSTSNQYLEFQTTNYESNMGQFTIPFLDMQEIVTNPPTLISGAGLYHKGESYGKSGGFLGLKLIQYDTSKHLLSSDNIE